MVADETGCALIPSDPPSSPPPPGPGPSQKNAWIFAGDKVVDIQVQLRAKVWDQLMRFHAERLKTWVPVDVTIDGELFQDAAIRLKGNPDRWDDEHVIQFVIRFDYYDSKGRFHGLRRINLDHEGVAPVRNTVGMYALRQAGVRASRTGYVRLSITTQDSLDAGYPQGLYGFYENIEVVDREFLEDRFADPAGTLYKHGLELKSGPDESDECDLIVLDELVFGEPLDADHTRFYLRIAQVLAIDDVITTLAAEATLGLGDNFWAGGDNYFLYNEPTRGMVVLPWDVDDVLSEVSPAHADLYSFHGVVRLGLLPNRLWQLIQQHPGWRQRFDDEVRRIREEVLPGLAPFAADQCAFVRDDVAQDPSRRFTMLEFDHDCETMARRAGERLVFLREEADR